MSARPFNHGTFTIERLYDASSERVFRALTEEAARFRGFASHED